MEQSRDGKDGPGFDLPMHWLRAAVRFAGEADAAAIRRIEWLVLGNAVFFLYLLFVCAFGASPSRHLSGLDQIILLIVILGTAALWHYETRVMRTAMSMTENAVAGYIHLFDRSPYGDSPSWGRF